MARVSTSSLICIALAAGGCFFADPINQRPAIDIRPDSSDPVFRKDVVVLHAIAADPEKHGVSFEWHVFACADGTDAATCDAEPFYTGIEPDASFVVPAFRVDADGAGPAPAPANESLRVLLDGRDDRGAAARPSQELAMPVLNHPPELEVRRVSTHGGTRRTSRSSCSACW